MQRERIHTLFIILYYTNTWLGTRHTQIQIKDISVDALFVGVVSSLEIVQKNNSLLCELKTFRYWNFACIDDYVDESLPVLCANVVMQSDLLLRLAIFSLLSIEVVKIVQN